MKPGAVAPALTVDRGRHFFFQSFVATDCNLSYYLRLRAFPSTASTYSFVFFPGEYGIGEKAFDLRGERGEKKREGAQCRPLFSPMIELAY